MPRRPLDGVPRITQVYGVRNSAYKIGYHTGVDYSVPTGTPVKSPTNGAVQQNGDGRAQSDGRGFFQIIRGDDGITHHLYHLRNLPTTTGRVSEGQTTAYSDNTGLSTGPHLHWETRRNNIAFNPADWLFAPAPAPAPAPTPQGGQEMISDRQQALDAYYLLRGDELPTEGEIAGTAGKRSWVEFARTGKPEVHNRERARKELEGMVGNLSGQVQNLTSQINDLNKRPTQAQLDELKALADKATAQADKDLKRAEELQKQLEDAKNQPNADSELLDEAGSWLSKLFDRIFKKKG